MDVVSVGPLRVGSVRWWRAEGRSMLTVVAKATFTLAPGACALAAEQEDVAERDNHWDDDPRRSVYAPGDLAPFKRRADVLLVGNAFAPQGKPVRSLIARLSVGAVDKLVEIVCQRMSTRDGEVRDGARWTRMALRYERAAGGPGTWNPVGVSPDATPDPYGQRTLPNLQPPGINVAHRSDFIAPVGFGPIAASWPSRRERLRHRAETWTEASVGTTPIDDDFDVGYFQTAPVDQQLDELRDDERIVIENMHPEHARLATQLPGLHPRAFVDAPGMPATEVALTADTLWIDTDRGRCTVTWRGQIQLAQRDQQGRVVVATEAAGQRLTWAAVRALPEIRGAGGGVIDVKSTKIADPLTTADMPREMILAGGSASPAARALPFAPSDGPAPIAVAKAGDPPARTGPRTTVEVAVPENIATTIPPWLAAQRAAAAAARSITDNAPARPPAPTFGAPPEPAPPAPPPTPARVSATPQPRPMAYGYGADRRPDNTPLGGAPEIAAPPPLTLGQMAAPSTMSLDPPRATRPPPPPLPAAASTSAEPRERSLAQAAQAGVAAASTAAAAAAPRVEASPSPTASTAPRIHAASGATMLELCWFDAEFAPRLRKTPAWSALFAPPPRKAPAQKGAPPPPPDPPDVAEGAARADVVAVLQKATPLALDAVEAEMMEALGESGTLTSPLVVVGGELELTLDGPSWLAATITAATPLSAVDKKLKETIDLCAEMTKGDPPPPEVIENLLLRVRDAWSKANRALPASYLDSQPERTLLEQRKYQKRTLLDADWIRAQLHMSGASDGPIPTYLKTTLEKRLPLFRRFAVRIIAEALPQQDQYESHPLALRVVALGRVVKAKARG